MKIYKAGLSTKHPGIQVPVEGKPGHTEAHVTVDVFKVLKVDELIAWCRDNPDHEAEDLADLLSEGAFG